jgi:hypothetical protein
MPRKSRVPAIPEKPADPGKQPERSRADPKAHLKEPPTDGGSQLQETSYKSIYRRDYRFIPDNSIDPHVKGGRFIPSRDYRFIPEHSAVQPTWRSAVTA